MIVTAVTRASIPELSATLRPALVRLTRVLRNQRVDMSVTISQLSAMAALATNGPMSAGELAAYERVQPPSMTKVLSTLVESGLVRREPHPSDRRQAIIALTEAGERLLDSERRSRDAWLSQQLARLRPEELALLAQVVPVLDKLAEQ